MASNANTSKNPSENPAAKGSNLNEKTDPNSNLQSLLELLLLQQREQNRNLFPEREIDSNIRRSGSAPSMDEGSLRSGSGLFRAPNLEQSDNNSINSKNQMSNNNSSCNNNSSSSVNPLTEEEIRSHPAYLEYYYAHDNAGSRLPPPLLSKEDWLMLQRVKASGYGLGHPRNKSPSDESVNSLLFSMQHMKNEEDDIRKAALRNISRKNSSEILDKLTHSGSGMGLRRKSFADILQEGTSQQATSRLSRPSSQNSMTEPNLLQMGNKSEISGNLLHPNSGSSLPSGAAEMLRKSPSSGLFTGSNLTENLNPATNGLSNVASSSIFELADAAESLSGLNMLSRGHQLNREDILKSSLLMRMGGLQSQNQQQHYLENLINSGLIRGLNSSNTLASEPMGLPRRTASTTNLAQAHLSPSDLASLETMQSLFNQKPNMMTMKYNYGGGSPLRNSNQAGTSFPFMDLDQVQSLRGNSSPAGFGNNNNNPRSCNDLQALEKAYLEALLLQQKQQYLSQFLHEISKTNHHQLHGNAPLGGYASSPSASPKSPMFQSDRSGDSPSTASRGEKAEPAGFSRSKSGSNLKGSFESSMEVAKNSKIKSLQLSDVIGHVVEFSKDRYGSRSIQQMLETANDSEKAKIFAEIIPHARELITDVYGNYVIQKFFEHGSDTQRKELAIHLIGRVLPLSLHMYGCRVIQKALEVVDVELKTKMVTELDGSITKCVCDQNGNHVIQKCIEHVPRDRIRFIFKSFLGQVVNLSSHPYGCRVIQRVLEHCDDPYTQQKIMDEILGSVCNLAQDQYGNYVLQHVLEHGKPGDRSAIVTKLAGQIVKMSQQKFASNVIEKCLVYGGPEERRIVVHEMLGSTDDNEPLQAMMKDPFGNYVVQKVLETCDDQSRELILSRIRVHLSALKRYTYGKHIVSRVEKLVTAGEKHTKKSSSVSSS